MNSSLPFIYRLHLLCHIRESNVRIFSKECHSGIKKGGQWVLKQVITFESVVVDVEKGRCKSTKRLLHKYCREKVKDTDMAEFS